MTNKPLLILSSSNVAIPKNRPHGGETTLVRPNYQVQYSRLTTFFENLTSAFVTDSSENLQPEYILVIDTVGRFDDFKTIVNHIKGLEWLAEIDTDEIEPDDLFYDSKKTDKKLDGRLFLTTTNRQAMTQLVSLFNSWNGNKNNLEIGFKSLHDLFLQIKDIRFWNEEDRLKESGILDIWNENLQFYIQDNSNITFEVHLWFKNELNARHNSLNSVKTLITSSGGRVLKTCEIEDIRFLAVKAELPVARIQEVIHHEYTGVFKCSDVMLFRPVGQIVVPSPDEAVVQSFTEDISINEPVAALLDGYPFANHKLLSNRITILDPNTFGESYLAGDMKHGTTMASLILHGELDSNELPLDYKLVVYPILKPNPKSQSREEIIPDDEFFEDLLVRAIRDILQNFPNIKIINLSIGDPFQMFTKKMSPTAKIVDWLSYKYNILFCISAGNVLSDLPFDLTLTEFENMTAENRANMTLRLLYNDRRNRRLLAPAEAINALTVGALHSDQSTYQNTNNVFDLLNNSKITSTISPFGFGFRNSIKPDILMPGGRQLYGYRNQNAVISKFGREPGQKVAISSSDNNRESCTYTRGTSNATALTTRSAIRVYSVLQELRTIYGISSIPNEFIAQIIKVLLIHGAEWPQSVDLIEENLKNPDNSRVFKKIITSFLGYGVPNIGKVLECTAQRATGIGFGKLGNKKRHEFRFPLPNSLSGSRIPRRLTVTLAWLSPTTSTNRRYRIANLSFETKENRDFVGIGQEADGHQIKNGTVKHQIFEGKKVQSLIDGDSIQIFVTCKEDATGLTDDIRYAIAVTLEVAEGIDIPIYEEVRQKIGTRVSI